MLLKGHHEGSTIEMKFKDIKSVLDLPQDVRNTR